MILDFVDPDGPEGTASIELAKRYLYGPAVDQILAQENVSVTLSADSRVLWPLGDHLQTTRDLVDQTGAVEEHFEYDSYGNVTSGDITLTRYLFTAREFGEATGLQYNRTRWYDAGVGRWVSEDPLGFPVGDSNLRRYVANSLTNAIDPSGLVEKTDPFPPPATHTGFTASSGHKAIIDYLNVTIEYKKGKDSIANCQKKIIYIGADQSEAKQIGHIYHELMSILSWRFFGYAEGSGLVPSGPERPAVFPNGKPVPSLVTGIQNLGLIVELAALAEHAPGELTPGYVDERFGTVNCRDPNDQNKTLIHYEQQMKDMVAWLKEVFEGKHDGEIYEYEMKAWKSGSIDKEILSVKVFLKADKGRIVDGKVHIVLED